MVECTETTYYDTPDGGNDADEPGNKFKAVKSEADLLKSFLRNYGTNKNWQRSFGGAVDADASSFNDKGVLRIKFNRPVVFPTALVSPEFDKTYQETIP